MNESICQNCHVNKSTMTSCGPMIWMCREGGELRGLRRPRKDVCDECALFPVEKLWPITHPLDSRTVKLGKNAKITRRRESS